MKTSSNDLQRYDDSTRMNHWAIALLFFAAALSGLAFFHPSMYFFTNLFGGGAWTRILHPYFGLLMFVAFLGIYVKLWRDNVLNDTDREWLGRSGNHACQNRMPVAVSTTRLMLIDQNTSFWPALYLPTGGMLSLLPANISSALPSHSRSVSLSTLSRHSFT
jgi:formate dehydrogenase gamma subunit